MEKAVPGHCDHGDSSSFGKLLYRGKPLCRERSMTIQNKAEHRIYLSGVAALPVTHCGGCPNGSPVHERVVTESGAWKTRLAAVMCKKLGKRVTGFASIDKGCPLPRREDVKMQYVCHACGNEWTGELGDADNECPVCESEKIKGEILTHKIRSTNA
jgi:DNA-directed RNA polymerase subunit RPC12/RpoP